MYPVFFLVSLDYVRPLIRSFCALSPRDLPSLYFSALRGNSLRHNGCPLVCFQNLALSHPLTVFICSTWRILFQKYFWRKSKVSWKVLHFSSQQGNGFKKRSEEPAGLSDFKKNSTHRCTGPGNTSITETKRASAFTRRNGCLRPWSR